MAFIYGIFYRNLGPFSNRHHRLTSFPAVFLVTIPAIFSDIYKQSIGIAGLNYISLGIGLTVASQVNARYMDRIYVYLKKRNNGVGEPEFRVRTSLFRLGALSILKKRNSCDGTRVSYPADRAPPCRLVRRKETTLDCRQHRTSP